MRRGLRRGFFNREVMSAGRAAAEHLSENRIEHAQLRRLARNGPIPLLLVGTLVLRGHLVRRVPHRMGETGVLREEQQRASELQQRSLVTI